jgi:hypothetical protein
VLVASAHSTLSSTSNTSIGDSVIRPVNAPEPRSFLSIRRYRY